MPSNARAPVPWATSSVIQVAPAIVPSRLPIASVAVVPLPSSSVHGATGPVVATASRTPPRATSTRVEASNDAVIALTSARVNTVSRPPSYAGMRPDAPQRVSASVSMSVTGHAATGLPGPAGTTRRRPGELGCRGLPLAGLEDAAGARAVARRDVAVLREGPAGHGLRRAAAEDQLEAQREDRIVRAPVGQADVG